MAYMHRKRRKRPTACLRCGDVTTPYYNFGRRNGISGRRCAGCGTEFDIAMGGRVVEKERYGGRQRR